MSITTANLLYFVFALGGAGIYFLLPRGDRSRAGVGAVLGLGALVVWLCILTFGGLADAGVSGFFYLFATIAVVAAVRVVTHAKPVYSALYFIMVVVAVAALLVLQGAEFLAVALIIIYAGAILVTYLFVIMLASQGGSPVYDRRAREPFMAVLGGFVLMAAVAGHVGGIPASVSEGPEVHFASDAAAVESSGSNTLDIGALVMTKYVVALEIAGVLLLVAMVGAIALSKKNVPMEGYRPPREPLGEIGKKVKPF